MYSIGETAQSTGVTRRMLRHWEQEGLLSPAAIDPHTGYRSYHPAQVGRVAVIAQLRRQGFGLDDIRALLDPAIAQTDLETVLTSQVSALHERISEAATRLAQIQQRLDTIRKDTSRVQTNLTVQPLPARTLWGASMAVLDETDIPAAVARLREQLRTTIDLETANLVQLYDGTDHQVITVTVGIEKPPEHDGAAPPLSQISTPGAPQGVSVTFDPPPASIADAWVIIDAHLEKQGLATHGIYRQRCAPDGVLTLEAAVRPARS